MESTDARPPRAGDGRARVVRVWYGAYMQESTHSRFAEMSVVLPHPTRLVVMSATVRYVLGVRIGVRVSAMGLWG